MTAYILPDFTGTDPAYKLSGDVYNIYKKDQKIIFDSTTGPIYAESLVIHKITGSLSNATSTLLVNGVDYIIGDDDIDYTITSKCKPYIKDDLTLINSISFKLTEVPILVSMDYQRLYNANPVSDPMSVGATIDLSPDLIIDMLRKIGSLDVLRHSLINPVALPNKLDHPKLLEFDIDKQLPENLIVDEVYNINTYNRTNIIKPIYGAFFKDSVIIKMGNTILQPNIDYTVQITNMKLSESSANAYGIYDCISFNNEYSGEVKITYHAVGGILVREDISSVFSWILGIKGFLTDNEFVTSDQLENSPIIKKHSQAIKELSEQMRTALSGKPTYSDTTTGKVSVRKLLTNTTNELFWYSIATLDTVAGSTQLVSKDSFKFNIQLEQYKYQASVIASIDTTINSGNRGSITILNSTFPDDKSQELGYGDFGNTNVRNVPPIFRIISSPEQNCGAVLQIGLVLTTSTETMMIEDMSGVESCWKMVLTDNTNILPTETEYGWKDNAPILLYKANQDSTITIPIPDLDYSNPNYIEVMSPAHINIITGRIHLFESSTYSFEVQKNNILRYITGNFIKYADIYHTSGRARKTVTNIHRIFTGRGYTSIFNDVDTYLYKCSGNLPTSGSLYNTIELAFNRISYRLESTNDSPHSIVTAKTPMIIDGKGIETLIICIRVKV